MSSRVINKRTSLVAFILIFIYFLATMRCWIGFGGNANIIKYAFPVIMIFLMVVQQVSFKFKKRYVVFAFLVFLSLLYNVGKMSNIFGIIDKMVPAVSILLILSLPDEEKERLLSFIIRCFGLLVLCGLPFYLLSMFTTLPAFGTLIADYGSEEMEAGLYANYLVYIRPLESISDGLLRFNSAFIEPGDLGCVSAFLLMAGRFNFKRYKLLNAVLLGLIASFSLAGYGLALVGYLFVLYTEKRISFASILGIIVFLLLAYSFATFYNGGDNVLNEKILSRLQASDDKGFEGNNRTSLLMDAYFLDMWNDRHLLLFGYDEQTVSMLLEKGQGAGFIRQIVCTGLIGLLGIILPFFVFSLTSSKKGYAMLFFAFLLMYVFQRTDTFWVSIVICYVYGIVIFERDIIHYEKGINNQRHVYASNPNG